ncbi:MULTISPECIES: PAS domain-containing protein [unclassified Bacillus (in: firmicutes)]|uniref:PAS domain-containing protein n=1 Tax=unclassified Bacillus (in: firmicutes) TaxID=185979 RepID=UPI000D02D3D8|nr:MULTISPECIES: STAS domain-containing protein [unclassified Bacillus (in: firmicutes)]PRR90468.1 biphenyl 2,3-dioxygenase [Bacillus sp. NMCN1]PRR98245.1 biphenyl 2,3-dioxygenase [Bacillus sp. NMCN6]
MALESYKSENLHLIKEALDYTQVGLTVTDPSLPDNPLIYVNKGFLDMTGYQEPEVLGKNCRFLQGNETEQIALQQIRTAIENKEAVTVQLKNYKKSGQMFWNELSVAPLWIDENEGKRLYFVGLQKDVTKEKEQQELLEQSIDEVLNISVPIVPVKDGISVLPIIGTLTAPRFHKIITTVSTYISQSKDDYFIVDLSGLLEVDSFVADAIFKLNDLILMTGTELIVTGIKPNLAMKMGEMKEDFRELNTYMNVKSALKKLHI